MKFGRCLLLLLFLLLAGCRAERVAFRFRPVSVQNVVCKVPSQPQRGDIAVATPNATTAKPQRGGTQMLPLASADPPGLGKRSKRLLLPVCRPAEAAARTTLSEIIFIQSFHKFSASTPTLDSGQNGNGLLLTAKILGALLAVVGLVALLAGASASTLATVGLVLAVAAALIGVVLAFDSL